MEHTRELTPTEKETLTKAQNTWSKTPIFFPIIFYLIAGYIYFVLQKTIKNYFGNYSFIFLLALAILPILQVIQVSLKGKREAAKYNLDLTQPVYQISGSVQIERLRRTYSGPLTLIWINNMRFDGQQLVNQKMLVDQLKNGDIVTLEYSPNSHYVWSIRNQSPTQTVI